MCVCACACVRVCVRGIYFQPPIHIYADVSGGYSPSMFDAMRTAIHASKAVSFLKPDGYQTISHHEALYLATLGGAKGNHGYKLR